MSTLRKVNQEKWYAIIGEYSESNETQDQFCLERGLNKGTFLYWLKKYQERAINNHKGFVKIIEPPLGLDSNFILKVGNVEIISQPGTSINAIARLVRELSNND